jgi:hypothetical protein
MMRLCVVEVTGAHNLLEVYEREVVMTRCFNNIVAAFVK